jgi:hypothetical protein
MISLEQKKQWPLAEPAEFAEKKEIQIDGRMLLAIAF